MKMTIEDIATEMRKLAWEIGGNHHSPKEAEEILIRLANQLSELNMNMSIKLNSCINEVNDNFMGISKEHRFLYLRHENIKEQTDEEID